MIRGISTHLFVAARLSLEQLKATASAGFDRIELFALKPHFDYQNRQLTSEIAAWFADQGPLLHSIHTPFCLDYQARGAGWLSIADPQRLKREKAIDEIKWALEFAEKTPLPYAVVHMGSGEDLYTLRHLDAVYYSLETLIPFARDRGVRLVLENIPNPLSSIEKMVRFLEESQLQQVGICFDSGHSNLQQDPAQEVESGGSRILTTHLHDNHGQKDEHLMPFHGSIAWPRLLEAFWKMNYQGALLLELKAGARDPFDVLKLASDCFDRFNRCHDELVQLESQEQ